MASIFIRVYVSSGTHYLRGVNNNLQLWAGSDGRKQFGLKPANPTEEGLASLHSVLLRKQPFLWRAALLYYTVHHAANMSFRQLFSHIARFVQDPDVRWEYCLRAKRGQTDTSQPGGTHRHTQTHTHRHTHTDTHTQTHTHTDTHTHTHTHLCVLTFYSPCVACPVSCVLCLSGCFSKDQVYLDGILRILRHRRSIDFKMLTSLGKVGVNDSFFIV